MSIPKDCQPGPLLSQVNSPADLKRLSIKELPQLAQELREYIICVVSQRGGHLAPNLGTIELTLALLYLYDPPVSYTHLTLPTN
mgnify:CR=1 FL=1